jgi:hypothetical protein
LGPRQTWVCCSHAANLCTVMPARCDGTKRAHRGLQHTHSLMEKPQIA